VQVLGDLLRQGTVRVAGEADASAPDALLERTGHPDPITSRLLIIASDAIEGSAALDALRKAAQGTENVLYPMREALKCMATVGEVCGVLRAVWGEYHPEVRL
jgi:hypothetical protein